MEIRIDQEFRTLIPEMGIDEKENLEEAILKDGCRDPLVKWEDTLIDGHNRYDICTRNGIGFMTVNMEFKDRDQAKIWIINNQLGRRNLTSEQSSNLRGLRYELEKKESGVRGPKKGGQNGPPKTAERIARETGVSARTVKRDAQFAKGLESMDPELKAKVLAGDSGLTKKQVIAWPNLSEEQRKEALEGNKKREGRKKTGASNSGTEGAGRPPKFSGNDLPPGETTVGEAIESSEPEEELLPKSEIEMKADAFIYQNKLIKVIGILPSEPPNELTEEQYNALKKTALLIIKRLRFFDENPELPSVIPADTPVEPRKYLERLGRAWKIVPKRVPKLNGRDRVLVEIYANKFFNLLEPFITVRPSDEFLKRYQKSGTGT
jgi:hypothetical protein